MSKVWLLQLRIFAYSFHYDTCPNWNSFLPTRNCPFNAILPASTRPQQTSSLVELKKLQGSLDESFLSESSALSITEIVQTALDSTLVSKDLQKAADLAKLLSILSASITAPLLPLLFGLLAKSTNRRCTLPVISALKKVIAGNRQMIDTKVISNLSKWILRVLVARLVSSSSCSCNDSTFSRPNNWRAAIAYRTIFRRYTVPWNSSISRVDEYYSCMWNPRLIIIPDISEFSVSQAKWRI